MENVFRALPFGGGVLAPEKITTFITQHHSMRSGQIKNLSYLKDNRRDLRKTLTPAEAAFWELVKNKRLDGRKFRKQVSIENYIVDFYCAEERIVIELDGEVHNHPQVAENDLHRDARLTDLGYTVLRFENKDVFNLTDWVLDEIRSKFK